LVTLDFFATLEMSSALVIGRSPLTSDRIQNLQS
jgi:hypothetical protein